MRWPLVQGEIDGSKGKAFAVTAFSIAVSVSGCAVHSSTHSSLTIPKDVGQPTDLTSRAQQEGKLSAKDGDQDCVLTTGDIHLWCKWINRYY
jgi:hypothetical protein